MEKELKILSESMEQKIMILQGLLLASKKQEELLSVQEPDLEAFDALVEKKDQMIDSVLRLDDGFETIYQKLSEGLKNNKTVYQQQIQKLQMQIAKVTEYSNDIQKQEEKNKKLLDDLFSRRKKELRTGRMNSKAVFDYYKNMNGVGGVTSTFMDSKHYRE